MTPLRVDSAYEASRHAWNMLATFAVMCLNTCVQDQRSSVLCHVAVCPVALSVVFSLSPASSDCVSDGEVGGQCSGQGFFLIQDSFHTAQLLGRPFFSAWPLYVIGTLRVLCGEAGKWSGTGAHKACLPICPIQPRMCVSILHECRHNVPSSFFCGINFACTAQKHHCRRHPTPQWSGSRGNESGSRHHTRFAGPWAKFLPTPLPVLTHG